MSRNLTSQSPPRVSRSSSGTSDKRPNGASHHWALHWWSSDKESSPASFDSPSPSTNTWCKSSKRVWVGRVLVVVVLVSTATALGYMTHRLLTNAEDNLAETQFESLTERALVEAEAISHRRRWSGVVMASVAGQLFPDAAQWPYVDFVGFETVVQALLDTSSGPDMGLAPLLTDPVNQGPLFEAHAYQVYRKLGFPKKAGNSSFGFGIWAQQAPNGTTKDKRYHDTTGETNYGSPYTIITPLFRTDEGFHPVLLFNMHSGKIQGQAIDRMLDCSERRRKNALDNNNTSPGISNCGTITDLFPNVKHNGRWGAALLRPIYPQNDPYTVVGYIPCLFLVDELLQNVFSDEITGIDAVFTSSGNQSVTYTVVNGEAVFLGKGDLHDTKYDKFLQKIELVDTSLYTEDSPTFWLSFTPNDDFAGVYETNNPAVGTLVTVLILIFTSMVFFLYDWFVRKELLSKSTLLDARRQFMRFVSHEVRTPLNSVSMGLDLLQADLAKVLGFKSPTNLRANLALNENGDRSFQNLSKVVESEPTGQSESISDAVFREKALEWFQLTQGIEANTAGAVDILNDLLNFDRIERGTLELQLEVASAWDLIEKVILEFKLPLSQKNIRLDISFCSERNHPEQRNCDVLPYELPSEARGLKLIADPIRLTQVLRNLMSNSLKFTPENGEIKVKAVFVESTIAYTSDRIELYKGEVVDATRRGELKVHVTDTGVGMTESQIGNLFNEGVQFNSNLYQSGGGSGLGLFICQGLVKQHKGTISATSDGLGKGSTFSISLPLWDVPLYTQASNAGKRAPNECSEDTVGTYSCNLLRILVVDDVYSNRRLLRRILENKGHVCLEAENGRVAVDMVKAAVDAGEPFDTCCIDYEMPVMDGPTACREIRDLGINVNIIGVTGNALPEDISYFISMGASEVTTKPVKIAELESLWRAHGIYKISEARMRP